MESQTACRPEKLAQTAPNLGLESLAAEASRRAELMETQAEPGPSGEGEGTARTSQASGQKSKVGSIPGHFLKVSWNISGPKNWLQ